VLYFDLISCDLILVYFSSLTLLANQIYAQIEEDKDLSVITSVELKNLFPGKKVKNVRFHKRMETFVNALLVPYFP
jgi:hypothetical protein